MPTIRFEVTGHVQGVGFRQYVQAVAEDLGVDGEVWNREDGAVEGIAAADPSSTLGKFEALLRQGPGRVDKIGIVPQPDQEFAGFRVLPSR